MRCEKTFQEEEAALAQSQMGENKVCLGTWVAFQPAAHAQKAWQELMGGWDVDREELSVEPTSQTLWVACVGEKF